MSDENPDFEVTSLINRTESEIQSAERGLKALREQYEMDKACDEGHIARKRRLLEVLKAGLEATDPRSRAPADTVQTEPNPE